jgi:hypothetical protein
VGKVKFVGRLPVVNVSGVEVVPSLRTSLIRYVVLGSKPATMKLVLVPGTIASEEVFSQVGAAGVSRLYWTYIELPEEGGALNRAIKGLAMGLTTALVPVIRVVAV